jgi:catechol 2,3-dioxygenase-like lactoylglutathione lyase family enzyme
MKRMASSSFDAEPAISTRILKLAVFAPEAASRLTADEGRFRANEEWPMTSSTPSGVLTAILPCNHLDASERFYRRLGFTRIESDRPPPSESDTYRLLSNGRGGFLHLTDAVEGWLVPGRNPFGLYLYLEDVDALAAEFGNEIIGKSAPEDKPWGMYEFALSDPDETLVRVGWPTRLRRRAGL